MVAGASIGGFCFIYFMCTCGVFAWKLQTYSERLRDRAIAAHAAVQNASISQSAIPLRSRPQPEVAVGLRDNLQEAAQSSSHPTHHSTAPCLPQPPSSANPQSLDAQFTSGEAPPSYNDSFAYPSYTPPVNVWVNCHNEGLATIKGSSYLFLLVRRVLYYKVHASL